MIDEEEFQSDFLISIRLNGKINASIVKRRSTENVLKNFRFDFVEIVRQAMKIHRNENFPLEIHDERSMSFVRFDLQGKCSFRYGIKENIFLQQESIDSSPSASAPTDYCRLTLLNFAANSK